MRNVGILHHPKIVASQSLGAKLASWLRARGHGAWECSGWDEDGMRAAVPSLDLLITLGGDGTILRAARIGAEHQVPILGIKMGRLGFLAELDPHDWQEGLEQLLDSGYWLEKRLMLCAELWRHPHCPESDPGACPEAIYEALNDVVISRGTLARIIRLDAGIDGDHLATYRCDGLIVSTATGCTAYALACGGPILPPELRNILLVAIAPHLSFDRPIVLAEKAMVSVRVFTDHAAVLTVDGQSSVDLRDGDQIVVRASPHSALFVRMQAQGYFYRTLMQRLTSPHTRRGSSDKAS